MDKAKIEQWLETLPEWNHKHLRKMLAANLFDKDYRRAFFSCTKDKLNVAVFESICRTARENSEDIKIVDLHVPYSVVVNNRYGEFLFDLDLFGKDAAGNMYNVEILSEADEACA